MSFAELEPRPFSRKLSPEEILQARFINLIKELNHETEIRLLPSSLITSDPEWRAKHPLDENPSITNEN